jgi:hypothetical protein
MAGISIGRVVQIVDHAVKNGGTVYVPRPDEQLETNHGYGGLDSDPDNVTGLVNALHSAAEYWLNGELDEHDESRERAEERRAARLENWIAREAREWAMKRALSAL